MKCNVGQTEKIVRIAGGSLIIIIGFYLKSWWGIVGLVPIITGAIGWCPINQIFGISTCKEKGEI